MPAPLKILLPLGLLAIAPCGSPDPATPEPAPPTGAESPAPIAEAPEPIEALPEEPPPPPDPALARRLLRVHSRLTPSVATRLRAIASQSEHPRDDVFAKMGGSSIESQAYLHCLGSDRNVDLNGRQELVPTIEFFREGNAGGGNPFRRESLAARKGWSLRHGLTGRPTRAIQELRATRARYALTLFGGNDVQARDPRRFGERLEQLLESVVPRGVIPVLGSTTPRGDDETMDRWARRYNRMSRGVARAWQIPYVDFYLALEELPNRGLAGDGVHSNVLLDQGRGRACVFTEEGLERGMNMRNLRTIESLHRLRKLVSGEEPPDPDPEPLFGEGTAETPVRIASAPFAERHEVGTSSGSLDGYACEGAAPAPGPERVYRIRLEEPTTLWLSSLARRGGSRVFLLGDTPDPASCVAVDDELEVELEAGVHHVVVEIAPQRENATMTFMIDYPVDDPASE